MEMNVISQIIAEIKFGLQDVMDSKFYFFFFWDYGTTLYM